MSGTGQAGKLDLRKGLARIGWLVLVALVVLVPLSIRVAWEGSAELEKAEAAAATSRVDDEVVHLGRAARWRLPLAGHDEVALARLMELGLAHEDAGERDQALVAYREARRAVLATRSFGLPDEETFHRANERIAALMAAQERDLGMDLSGEADQEHYHLALLEEVPGPNRTRSGFAALCFLAWLIATAGFVMRGLDAQGRLRTKTAVRWGGASIVLLIAWMVLMRNA